MEILSRIHRVLPLGELRMGRRYTAHVLQMRPLWMWPLTEVGQIPPPIWAYRSFPETDSRPPHRVLPDELLRLQPYQRDPNDPACAARVAQLRASISAYGNEEIVRARNTHLRTSERSVRSSEVCAPT